MANPLIVALSPVGRGIGGGEERGEIYGMVEIFSKFSWKDSFGFNLSSFGDWKD